MKTMFFNFITQLSHTGTVVDGRSIIYIPIVALTIGALAVGIFFLIVFIVKRIAKKKNEKTINK